MMFDKRSFFRHHLRRYMSRSKGIVGYHNRAEELVFKSHPFHLTGKVFRIGLSFGEFLHIVGNKFIIESCIATFELTALFVLAYHHVPIKIESRCWWREYLLHIMGKYLALNHILIIRDSIYEVEIRSGVCHKTHSNHLSIRGRIDISLIE